MKTFVTKGQPNPTDTSSAKRTRATGTSRGAGTRAMTGEDFAEYSHAMLLSLQRLALDEQANALSRLLGETAAEAKRLMKEKHAA